jgi:hypothetical protein
MAALKSGSARGEEAITATAELLNLTDSQVRTAVRYYGAFADEIDRRIALNTEDANEAEAAWRAGDPYLSHRRKITFRNKGVFLRLGWSGCRNGRGGI